MTRKNDEKLLAASFIEGMEAERKRQLAQGEDLEVILSLVGDRSKRHFEEELQWVGEKDYPKGYLFWGDEGYPETLMDSVHPPFRLAYIGNPPVWENSITVVGTRKCSYKDLSASYSFGLSAALNGAVVYSGFADGIDWGSHNGAVDGGGKTFAVLASGLNNDYALRRPRLLEKMIEKGGGILSPYTANMEAFRGNFASRNRVLGEISEATVVISCPEKSGSLMTSNAAADAGRDVFVHAAGVSEKDEHAGTSRLAKEGAKVISDWAGIADALFMRPPEGGWKRVAALGSDYVNPAYLLKYKNAGKLFRFAETWYIQL